MKKKIKIIILFLLFLSLISCKSIDFNTLFSKTVEIECIDNDKKSYATGFFINENGLILTNRHVVDGFKDINVFVNNEVSYEAIIYDISNEYDLALLKIEYKSPYFKIEEHYEIGEELYSIGNPNGLGLSLYDGMVTSGIKTLHYQDEVLTLLQTNIEIYDGCSGGPVINHSSNVIGMNTLRIKDNGSYIPGVSYAIPGYVINEYLNGINY